MARITLSPKEQDILCCLSFQGRDDIPSIARQTGYRQHTVRYALENLKAEGVIMLQPVIDVYALGFVEYDIFFTFSSRGIARRKKILQALINSPQVAWIGHFSGDYQFGFSLCISDVRQFRNFLQDLSKNFGDVFHHKSFVILMQFTEYRPKFFSTKFKSPEKIAFGVSSAVKNIDSVDHQILQALSMDAARSGRESARHLNLTPSTYQYRLRQLEEKNIITGYTYVINYSRLGMYEYRLLVSTHDLDPSLPHKLEEFARKHKNIVYFIECIGTWDFELGAIVQDLHDIDAILEDLHGKFSDVINSTQVLTSFGYPKVVRYPLEKLPG